MKINKPKFDTPKFFGWPDEKWAKGGGRYGYGRGYGKNKHGIRYGNRTRQEIQFAIDKEELGPISAYPLQLEPESNQSNEDEWKNWRREYN